MWRARLSCRVNHQQHVRQTGNAGGLRRSFFTVNGRGIRRMLDRQAASTTRYAYTRRGAASIPVRRRQSPRFKPNCPAATARHPCRSGTGSMAGRRPAPRAAKNLLGRDETSSFSRRPVPSAAYRDQMRSGVTEFGFEPLRATRQPPLKNHGAVDSTCAARAVSSPRRTI